jgi:hypothetical protein
MNIFNFEQVMQYNLVWGSLRLLNRYKEVDETIGQYNHRYFILMDALKIT